MWNVNTSAPGGDGGNGDAHKRRNGVNGETKRRGWDGLWHAGRDAGCKPASGWASVTVGPSRLRPHRLVPAVTLVHPTALRAVAPHRITSRPAEPIDQFNLLRFSVGECLRVRASPHLANTASEPEIGAHRTTSDEISRDRVPLSVPRGLSERPAPPWGTDETAGLRPLAPERRRLSIPRRWIAS